MPHLQLLATALTVLAAFYLAACIVFFGQKTRGYRHLRHTISELGEVGAPHQRAVAFGFFLPIGTLLLVVASLLLATSQTAALLALCIAVGYLVAAFFPCDPGSPASGTTRQGIHNLGGAVEYIGGGVALEQVSDTPFRPLGLAVLGAAALLTILPNTSVRGLFQRLAETGLFAGLALAAATTYAGA